MRVYNYGGIVMVLLQHHAMQCIVKVEQGAQDVNMSRILRMALTAVMRKMRAYQRCLQL